MVSKLDRLGRISLNLLLVHIDDFESLEPNSLADRRSSATGYMSPKMLTECPTSCEITPMRTIRHSVLVLESNSNPFESCNGTSGCDSED